jgi:hypothetical protein
MTHTLRYLHIPPHLYDRRQYYEILKQRDGTYRNVLKFGMRSIIQVIFPQFFFVSKLHSISSCRINSVKGVKNYLHNTYFIKYSLEELSKREQKYSKTIFYRSVSQICEILKRNWTVAGAGLEHV